MSITTLILQAVYFSVPAYFANMAPVIMKNVKVLEKPIDSGLKINGKPLFGKNKTYRGLVFAIIFGIIGAYLQQYLYGFTAFRSVSITDYSMPVMLGLLMGAGAIIGDLIESFAKRRINFKPGQSFIPFDQTDFIFGAYLFIWPFWNLFSSVNLFEVFLASLIASFFLHIIVNHLAYYLKIRKEKW